MTISRRLIILVSAALASLLCVGLYGSYMQWQLSGVIVNFRDVDYPSLERITSLRSDAHKLRVATLSYLLETDAAQRQKFEADLKATYDDAMHSVKVYGEQLANDNDDRKLLAEDRKAIEDYYQNARRLFDAISQDNAELAMTYRRQIDTKGQAMVDAATRHVEYNKRWVTEEVTTSERTIMLSRILSWVAMILGTVITGGVGTFLGRSIARSLAGLRGTIASVESSLDFTLRAPSQGNDEVATTARAFNSLIERMQESLKAIMQQSNDVSAAAAELAQTANQVSTAATAQSDASATVAATVEEMTVSVNHVGDRAGSVNEETSQAGSLASSGEAVINHTVQSIRGIADTVRGTADNMTELEQQSKQIAASVSIIKEVAEQTNLLALNAAIEAARAGEQGRGFAVVADEVRKLAERTAAMTAEIDRTISAMSNCAEKTAQAMSVTVDRVEQGVRQADDALNAMGQISQKTGHVAAMIGDITSAIREQGIASNTIASQIEHIAQMAEESSAAAEQTAGTAFQLNTAAEQMHQIVQRYRL
ncbi:methyl-accepting chemotaxis protein [Uliginosibacterium sp. sgz301328]|uniref:methyl-accepting chemotaxis protein n=1 Tax=Uliginosibacterium sp. sgz301328 TaxID=3243764 RepID=UPI00359CD106